MELILILACEYSDIKSKYHIIQTCKTCEKEFENVSFCEPSVWYLKKSVLRHWKKTRKVKKTKIVKFSCPHRRLHREDDPILVF